MLHRTSSLDEDEPDDLYDEYIKLDDERDEEEEEAERLMEIESELYSYVHYGSQTDLESETVDPKLWIFLEKDNSAVNRPLMRLKVNGNKNAEDIGPTKTFKCGNCSLVGHLSRDCRQMKPIVCYLCGFLGHIRRECPNNICFNCECPGHLARNCNESKRFYKPHCFRCDMIGHKSCDCPDLWRRYHVTTKEGPIVQSSSLCNPRVYCSNCGACGHFAYDCHKPTMYNYPRPSYPFIISYKDNRKSSKVSMHKNGNIKIKVGNDDIPVKKWKNKDKTKIVKKIVKIIKSKKKERKNKIPIQEHIRDKVKKKIKAKKKKKIKKSC